MRRLTAGALQTDRPIHSSIIHPPIIHPPIIHPSAGSRSPRANPCQPRIVSGLEKPWLPWFFSSLPSFSSPALLSLSIATCDPTSTQNANPDPRYGPDRASLSIQVSRWSPYARSLARPPRRVIVCATLYGNLKESVCRARPSSRSLHHQIKARTHAPHPSSSSLLPCPFPPLLPTAPLLRLWSPIRLPPSAALRPSRWPYLLRTGLDPSNASSTAPSKTPHSQGHRPISINLLISRHLLRQWLAALPRGLR